MGALVRGMARAFGGALARTDDTTLDALNWADWGWSVPTAAGAMVNQASAMQVSSVYSCVKILSEDLAKLGAALFTGDRKGKSTKVSTHYLAKLLNKPAPWLTWFEFCCFMQAAVLLRGNGYAVIVRDNKGVPQMLVPINPDRVALWEAPDGELFYMVTRSGLHEMAVLRKEPLLIHSDDIFHLKALSLNGLLGLSPISMARESIGLSIAQEQLASRWAGNGARPSGVLQTKQRLAPDTAKRLADDWKTLHSGTMNAGKVAVLEQGLEWKALAMSSVDMEFLASRQFQLTEIARIYRVPMHMLGAVEASRGTGITQQAQEYLNYSLSTWIEMWEQRVSFTFDLPDAGLFLAFDVDRLLKADITTRYGANRLALGGTGWRTINQVRADEGEEPVPDGDEVFRPVNTAPLSSDIFQGMPGDPDPKDAPNPSGPGSDQTGAGAPGAGKPPKKGIKKESA